VTSPEFAQLKNRVWLDVREEVLKHYSASADQTSGDRTG